MARVSKAEAAMKVADVDDGRWAPKPYPEVVDERLEKLEVRVRELVSQLEVLAIRVNEMERVMRRLLTGIADED